MDKSCAFEFDLFLCMYFVSIKNIPNTAPNIWQFLNIKLVDHIQKCLKIASYFGSLNTWNTSTKTKSLHPTAQVLIIKNGPFGTLIQCPTRMATFTRNVRVLKTCTLYYVCFIFDNTKQYFLLWYEETWAGGKLIAK